MNNHSGGQSPFEEHKLAKSNRSLRVGNEPSLAVRERD